MSRCYTVTCLRALCLRLFFEDAMRRKHLEILTAWERYLRELLQGMDWNAIQKASRKYLQGALQEKHPFLILGKDSPGFRDIVRFEPVLNLNQEKEAKAAVTIRGESEWIFFGPGEACNLVHFTSRSIRPKQWIRLFLMEFFSPRLDSFQNGPRCSYPVFLEKGP